MQDFWFGGAIVGYEVSCENANNCGHELIFCRSPYASTIIIYIWGRDQTWGPLPNLYESPSGGVQ